MWLTPWLMSSLHAWIIFSWSFPSTSLPLCLPDFAECSEMNAEMDQFLIRKICNPNSPFLCIGGANAVVFISIWFLKQVFHLSVLSKPCSQKWRSLALALSEIVFSNPSMEKEREGKSITLLEDRKSLCTILQNPVNSQVMPRQFSRYLLCSSVKNRPHERPDYPSSK